MIRALLRAEGLRLIGGASQWITPLLFFVLALSCYSLMLASNTQALRLSSTAAVWVTGIFSVLLSTNQIFTQDQQNGLIDQIRLASVSLTGWVMIRLSLHWLVSGFCLVLLCPLAGVFMGLSLNQTFWLGLSLLLGTPVVVLFAALAQGLSTSAGGSGAFAALIALPLMLPVLIFGAGMMDAQGAGLSPKQPLLFMIALLLVAVATLPYTIAATLKLTPS